MILFQVLRRIHLGYIHENLLQSMKLQSVERKNKMLNRKEEEGRTYIFNKFEIND